MPFMLEEILMRIAAQIISWCSLILLTVPSLLFLTGRMELSQVKNLMFAATIIWFVSASLWMWNSNGVSKSETEASPGD